MGLCEFVATEVPLSISSGESEFYALLRAAVEAKFLHNLMTWLEFDEKLEVPELVSDATAALGAAARLGVGKRMKHIETQTMFVQTAIAVGKARIRKIKGTSNPADVLTKYVNKATMDKAMAAIGARIIGATILVS